MNRRLRVEVRGIVQGVGFRPYIYRLAQRYNLGGSIHNSESGVSIEIQGESQNVAAFITTLPLEAPTLAHIHEIDAADVDLQPDSEFIIVESTRSTTAKTLISPDIATCGECVQEMLDPANRRYLYPFINCTNCGPRFTIVRQVPYDRKQTSMANFSMCPLCQSEYDDPLDRRFHAQPNACWICGPQLELVDKSGKRPSGDPILEAIRLLKAGESLAIKGLGGFHLAVDANQPKAVQELRNRKARGEKPFAVMVPNIATAQALCLIDQEDAALLESPQRPIVLLPRRTTEFNDLAPDNQQLGVFLPYTPLHHLLFSQGDLTALVMTSANLSEEPIAINNAEALDRLQHIAGFFLMHNRDILLRCDDSVARRVFNRTQFARRSRGFVPSPIELMQSFPPILAVGGELKNTICLSRDRYAFLGQHIGDLENLSAFDFFQESISHFQQILEVQPGLIAHDLHPAYLATRWAKEQSNRRDLPIIGVQHHHAHIASCMAEHHLTGPVIGIALDGTGYGTDGQAWGGEILIANLQSFKRAAQLAYVPMPGGEQAIREPWRMAVSQLWHTFGEDWQNHVPAEWLTRLRPQNVAVIEQLLARNTSMPLTSSCGRLFDAVSSLVCNRIQVSYEAQAAIILEACCSPNANLGAYPFSIAEGPCLQVETQPLFAALTEDLCRHASPAIMSTRFHAGLVNILANTTSRIAQDTEINQVCLSGGSFQNAVLSRSLEEKLTGLGFTVFVQEQVPPGDGGLSLGQLVIAANQP
jgi:hydrogenase maturation protein HypF